MSTDLLELQKLQKFIERQQKEIERAKGALEENLKILRRDFDCNSIEEAQKELENLEEQQADEKREFDKALADFKEKWLSGKDEE